MRTLTKLVVGNTKMESPTDATMSAVPTQKPDERKTRWAESKAVEFIQGHESNAQLEPDKEAITQKIVEPVD